jgi:acetoin utilization protein AcuC
MEISPGWITLGGGGYEITNVARAWTLAWAIMNNVDLPDELLDEFLRQYPLEGFRNRQLRDNESRTEESKKKMMRDEGERIVLRIREKVFPLIKRI